MPYDPNFPADGVLIESLPFRDQFHGIKDLIDAVPTLDSAQVDSTTTLPPGTPAQASVSVLASTLHFEFQIPEGATGPQGSQGEVSQAALDAAILGTSSNSNGVGTLGQPADASYSQPQMQALMDKVDELIQALRR